MSTRNRVHRRRRFLPRRGQPMDGRETASSGWAPVHTNRLRQSTTWFTSCLNPTAARCTGEPDQPLHPWRNAARAESSGERSIEVNPWLPAAVTARPSASCLVPCVFTLDEGIWSGQLRRHCGSAISSSIAGTSIAPASAFSRREPSRLRRPSQQRRPSAWAWHGSTRDGWLTRKRF